MSIMDQPDESDGSIKKEEIAAEQMRQFKKLVADGLGNGFVGSKEDLKDPKKERRRRKKKTTQKVVDGEVIIPSKNQETAVTKKLTDTKKESEVIIRSDSPGLDLSIFQPRGKRKCVIQNEGKKAYKHKDDWWSDEDAEEDEEEEEIKDDDEKNSGAQPKAIEAPKKRRKNNKQNTKINPETIVTRRSYVFSTGMANRAGHAVSKSVYSSITEYHHAQRWNTPYLSAEVHCRPFLPEIEEEEQNKDLAAGLDLATCNTNGHIENHNSPPQQSDTNVSSSETVNTYALAEQKQKEHMLCVDTWQREQVINVAQQMSRIKARNENGDLENIKRNPLHPRYNLMNNIVVSQCNGSVKSDTEKSVVSNDSDSSPQTVPRLRELASVKEEVEKEFVPKNTSSSFIAGTSSSAAVIVEDIRKKDISSPPQLVPTFSHNDSIKTNSYPADITDVKEQLHYQSPKNNSYPADITNLKGQLRYQSPKEFKVEKEVFDRIERDMSVRPSVLNMSTNRKDSENVRSTIDVAEKALKESRTIPFKPTGPILPRDIHPSVFMSRHSPHLHTTGFNSHIPSISFSSRIHSPFSPPASILSTSLHSPHGTDHHPHIPPVIPPQFSHRHPLHSSFHESELKFSDKYKLLSSAFGSHRMPLNDRPASLPMVPSTRIDKRPSKSFSVESLTSYERKDKNDDHIERSIERLHERIPRSIGDRPPGIPDHLSDRMPGVPDRIHTPNGLNIHNGLKRSLDERLSNHIMERAQHDKTYFEQLQDKDRFLLEKDRYILEKDRFLHRPNLQFSDPRSPIRLPPAFLPRSLPNGSSSDMHPPPGLHPAAYSHLHRLGLNPYTSAQFTNR